MTSAPAARAPTATLGVLALQGDVREHLAALARCGVDAVPVRRETELSTVAGLVLPGGESTAIERLLRSFGLYEPLRARIAAGLPVLGSCAGMILLADRITDAAPGQAGLGGIDMTVCRNAFGRQVDSFEADLDVSGLAPPSPALHAVFIRAPGVVDVGPDVEILARLPARDTIVAVRQGPLVATAFHPEVGGDDRIHRLFVELVRSAAAAVGEPRPVGRH